MCSYLSFRAGTTPAHSCVDPTLLEVQLLKRVSLLPLHCGELQMLEDELENRGRKEGWLDMCYSNYMLTH